MSHFDGPGQGWYDEPSEDPVPEDWCEMCAQRLRQCRDCKVWYCDCTPCDCDNRIMGIGGEDE